MRTVLPIVGQRILVCLSVCLTATVAAVPASAQGYGQPYAKPVYSAGPAPFAPPSRAGASRRSIDQSPREFGAYGRPNIWQGLYIGGHVGADFGGADADKSVSPTGGLHVGYNWQWNNVVAGLEVDASAKSLEASRNYGGGVRTEASQDWASSMRLRLGYAFDNTLIYATGGYAIGNFDVGLRQPGVAYKSNDTLNGYVVGAGVEMKFAPNWSGRVEGLYYGFAEKTYAFPTGTVKTDVDYATVRAGLTYHFN